LGDPNQGGGPDYTGFPESAYFLDTDDVGRPGTAPMLEVPLTAIRSGRALVQAVPETLKRVDWVQRLLTRASPVLKLRPNGKNRGDLVRVVKRSLRDRKGYLNFMLHSSEFMPGGSPTFPTDRDIESLYEDLEVLFSLVQGTFVGATLTEYYQRFHKEMSA
jgi:hypothetical protein